MNLCSPTYSIQTNQFQRSWATCFPLTVSSEGIVPTFKQFRYQAEYHSKYSDKPPAHR